MRKFDLILIGNGILATFSAIKIKKKFPKLSVAIVGPRQRTYSASIAAGAMHAAFCEVEDTFHSLQRDRDIFHVALKARPLWREFLSENDLEQVITADSTVMYRRLNGTPFEKANFESACSIALEHKALADVEDSELEKIFCGNLNPSDVEAKKFVGEFAIDTALLFEKCTLLLEKMGVTYFPLTADRITSSASSVNVQLSNEETISAEKVIVAAGTASGKILPQPLKMVPIYHAVGTAMVLDSAPHSYSQLKYVIRTPNRGGAQCGMHIVPRNFGKFYLGAGNYLSNVEPAHRVETIRYLIDICETELYGKQIVYNAKAELLLGSRPKSVDGFPVMGSFKEMPNIYVATGMYRIALTIAPVVADEILQWYETGKAADTYSNWSPSRDLHSYAPIDVAVKYYSESRISNLIEHGILKIEQTSAIEEKKQELQSIARKLNTEIINLHNLPQSFVVDPDMYSIMSNPAQM